MSKLKAVIFSIDHVIIEAEKYNEEIISEVVKLISFLQNMGITPVVLSRRSWFHTDEQTRKKTSLKEMLFKNCLPFLWYCCSEDPNMPVKNGSGKTVQYILEQSKWKANEIIYIGNSLTDMRTAINAGVLFLNANWYLSTTPYGFIFDSPREIAKFIDVFCIRDHWWEFSIEQSGLQVYSLSTFSTYIQKYCLTTTDAKAAAKYGGGKLKFWAHYLISTIYFSGLYEQIDYIASYPTHKVGGGNDIIGDVLDVFAKCFRARYIPDLIIRHTQAQKSQTLRQNNQRPTFLNQLNTIHLNKSPIKNNKQQRYLFSPLARGKTILVIDDFLTDGFSLGSARQYIEATGAKAISLAWLKTLNTPYHKGKSLIIENPYDRNRFEGCCVEEIFNYKNHISDPHAHAELHEKFNKYDNWNWPEDVSLKAFKL